jgi:hypothetical protein
MRAINVLLAVLVSLAIGLGIFEVGLRLIGKGPTPQVLEFDPHTGWKKRANLSLQRKGPEYSVRLATNELGLADDPMSTPAKPAGTYRVVALGDSFTQGFTVDRKDLFVDQLEHWWKAEGRNVDVVNAGCEAYSTDQEVAWMLRYGPEFRPDAVALFAYENDIYWCGSPTYQARDAGKPLFRADGTLEIATVADVGGRPWYEKSGIGLLLKPFLARPDFSKYTFTPAGAARPVSREFAPLLVTPPDFVADARARCQGALAALKRTCDELHAKLVLVPIPGHAAIDPVYAEQFATANLGGLPASAWSADRPVDMFLDMARELGISALDPRPALREEAARGTPLYFGIDWHLNPDGNRVLSRFLHDELDRIGFLPGPVTSSPPPEVAHASTPARRWPYVFAGLWVVLGTAFVITYRGKENPVLGFLGVGVLLALVFTILIGGGGLLKRIPPPWSTLVGVGVVVALLGFVAWKLGRRLATIFELLFSFTLRGHWYLMPLVVVLLSIGSLLVVAASSPLIAPFIYTLF